MFKFNDTLMHCVQANLKSNTIPMLLGEPGIGKSSWLENLAFLNHTKCFTLACNQLADKADLTGARLIPISADDPSKGYKQVFYPHAVISDAIEYANANPREYPILFLDELNRTTPDVTSEALSIPTMRQIGSKKLPDNLRVVIAGNDKGNITALDEASISRFILYHVEPDVQTFFAVNPDLNQFIKNTLTAHPDCIFCKKLTVSSANAGNDDDDDDDNGLVIEDIINDGDEMSQITTPRTISALSKFLNSLSQQEILEMLSDTFVQNGEEMSVLQEVIEGHVGKTNFSVFLLANIAENVAVMNTQTTQMLTVGKPSCYDEMKAQTSLDDLNKYVKSLSDNDRSGCLLYALYERTDNEIYIKTISSNIQSLTQSDMRTLLQCQANNQLDNDNVKALLNTRTPISTSLSVILELSA